MTILWWLLPAVAGTSWGLTALLRHYALARNLLDVPNSRSSHTTPTPRGGGLAVVLSLSIALPLLALAGALAWPLAWALLGSGGAVALVGFLDDHGHVAPQWRLLAHFGAAAWALFWLGGVPQLSVPGASLGLGWLGYSVGAVYLVWLLNLYNFMDGIDGIASMEAITVSIGWIVVFVFVGKPGLGVVPAVLAISVAGFFVWNFPPARIFMGDVGSGFLGLTLGVLSLDAGLVSPRLWWCSVILLGVFVVDATWTLLRRLSRGERIHEAHRDHAYQHASRRIGRHLPVTLAVGAINLLWLLPIALTVGLEALEPRIGVLIAYFPLFLVALWLRAGLPDESRAPAR